MYETTLRILSDAPFAQAAAEGIRARDLLCDEGFDVERLATMPVRGDSASAVSEFRVATVDMLKAARGKRPELFVVADPDAA